MSGGRLIVMRRAKNLALLIVMLPMLAMAAMSGVFLAGRMRAAWDRLPELIASAWSEQFNGSVTVAKIGFSSPGEVWARGVVVTDGLDSSRHPILKSDEVRIRYRTADVICRGVDPIGGIETVELVKPNISLERGTDGRWNVAGLLKPSAVRPPTLFRGRVVVKSGIVAVEDRLRSRGSVETNGFRTVNAVIDFSEHPVADYAVSARGQPGRLGRVELRGWYKQGAQSFNAHLDVLDADAAYWSRYPRKLGFLDMPSGRVDAHFGVSRGSETEPVKYSGSLAIRRASARFAKIRSPVEDVEGEISVRNGVAGLDLRGRLGSSPFLAKGRILDFEKPRLALELSSERADFEEIGVLAGGSHALRGFSLPTSGRLGLKVFGPVRSPSVRFEAELPTFSHAGLRAADLSVAGTYADGRVFIEDIAASAYGGRLDGSGEIRFGREPGFELTGRALGVRLGETPIARERSLAATTTGEFEAVWDADGASVTYRGSLSDGKYRDLRFDDGRVAAVYQGDSIRIEELSLKAMGGLVAASGSIGGDGALELIVAGSDVNLAALEELYWDSPTVGRVGFAGKLGGTLKSPVFEGEVEADRVMVSGAGFERITASLDASLGRVGLHDLVIHDYPGTVTVTGGIYNPLARAGKLDLRVKAESLCAERIAQFLAPSVAVSGDLSADVAVTGTVRHPRAEGRLNLAGGEVSGTPFDSVDARLVYRDSTFGISEFEAHAGDSVLRASGEFVPDGRIDLNFAGGRLALGRIAAPWRAYALASGTAAVEGHIGGTFKAPELKMEVNSDGPTINGQRFTGLSASVRWTNAGLIVSDFILAEGGSRYSVPKLAYTAPSSALEFTAQAEGGEAAKLLRVLDGSPYIALGAGKNSSVRRLVNSIPRPFRGVINGTVSGSVHLTDKGAEPDLSAEGTLTDLVFGDSRIQTVRLDAAWRDGVVRINSLEALDEDTSLFAEASIQPDHLEGKLDAHGLSLGALGQWVKLPHNFSGTADVTIVAGGSTRSPSGEACVEIVDPVLAGVKFDRLRSRLSVDPGGVRNSGGPPDEGTSRISIDELTLVAGTHDLRASGFLPVDWHTLSIPEDGPLLLTANFDDETLDLLSVFTGLVVTDSARGTLEGSVGLGGTVAAPRVEGSLAWRNGGVRLVRLDGLLEDIDALVRLSGSTLTVERFKGRSSEGGGFSVAGAVSLAELKPKLDLKLDTDGLRISGKNISNAYGEYFGGRIDSTLRVTGDWRRPLVAGDVMVPEGLLTLSGKAQKPDQRIARTGIDPSFDIRVSLGRDLVFKTARLKTPMFGDLVIAGSLSRPLVEGTIDITDGTVLFPTRSFKILPGSDLRLSFCPPQPTRVLLDVRAQTRLAAVSPLGRRQTYTVTMEAKGPLDEIDPTFTASPPGISEGRIISLLTGQPHIERIFGGQTSRDVSAGLSGLFSSAMMPSVFEPIEEAFEEALGLEDIALELGYQEPLRLSMSDQLWDGLYLSYTAILGSRVDYADSRYEVGLSYRFRNLELGLTTDEQRTLGVTLGGRLKF